MKRAVLLSILFVIATAPLAPLHARDVGSDLPANSLPTLDDDDDEAFFSGGANPALPAAPVAAVRPAPKIDMFSTCRAVLSDDASHYAKRFYDTCRVIASQTTTRQASR